MMGIPTTGTPSIIWITVIQVGLFHMWRTTINYATTM